MYKRQPETTSGNLELPSKGSKAGSEITWSSSNESVITKDGKVTRDVYKRQVGEYIHFVCVPEAMS